MVTSALRALTNFINRWKSSLFSTSLLVDVFHLLFFSHLGIQDLYANGKNKTMIN